MRRRPTLPTAGRSSAWLERCFWGAEAEGSNPSVPTFGSSVELPGAAAEDRHGLARSGDAVHLELVAADHEVGVQARRVGAALVALLVREVVRPRQRLED